MFRQSCTGSFVALLVLGSFHFVMAEEPKATGEKQITNSIGMKLTLVPSGEFMMGSRESAEETLAFFKEYFGIHSLANLFESEHPQHRVRITKPFYLGTYHVTRGQFRQFVNDSGYKTDQEKDQEKVAKKKSLFFQINEPKYSWRNPSFKQTDDHPVVYVSWNDAVAFCKWLSGKEGKTYQLPSEAQWEYACRAGMTTRYYSGDDPETLAKVGNVADAALTKQLGVTLAIKTNDGYVDTSPVGRFKPNGFGLYDMHGNAEQWCSDWYARDYYSKAPLDDPKGPDTGDQHVARGSSSASAPDGARSACRYGFSPDARFPFTGFRVARAL
jgi:formylglycine-generating enzyme